MMTRCEDCLYYDYDDETESYSCIINLEEDEAERFMAGRQENCAYFRFYDEYKMVRKQQ